VASPVKPGDVLAGRYRVESVLGEGGMGVVLAAEHLVLGERVAIKLLLPEAAELDGVVQRFQREARAVSRIQSEHVARVMDVGALDDGAPYMVMEYVDGRDLAAELEARGPLPVEEAVGWVLQAAVGVAEAHALGIVHRDLKPSNLFLAKLPNGRLLVKVLDFGIAKDTQDVHNKNLTSTFSALGSAAYMSPEQVRMAKSVDTRTDVWALGVVLFELLTGQMPFEGESVTATAASIIADQPRSLRELRPDVPPELENVVMHCLEKIKERRTASLSDLATALVPFGGRSAAMLASRISETLGPPPEAAAAKEQPSSAPPASALAPTATPKTEIATTRPAWTTERTNKSPNRRARRPWLVAMLGVLAVIVAGVALLGLRLLKTTESAPVTPFVAPPTQQAASPTPTFSAPATPADTAVPERDTATPPTRVRSGPVTKPLQASPVVSAPAAVPDAAIQPRASQDAGPRRSSRGRTRERRPLNRSQ
jgi:serine/threonine protein kinase